MKKKIIAAIGKNRELGINQGENYSLLNWKLPGDLERFKHLTEGHIVLMGRKTWDSLPQKARPLANRLNVILTRNKDKDYGENVFLIDSKDELDFILKYDKFKNKDLWIMGGGEVYKMFLEDVDELYLTEVEGEFPEANVFFPEFKIEDFEMISDIFDFKDNENHSHKFRHKIYKRK
jgi:dihydrofolate reductase